METENIITKLKELDLSSYPKDEIVLLLEQLKFKMFCIKYTFHDKLILRARPNQSINQEFRNISDYSYVPLEKNLKYCRASVPKKSMIYASVVLEDGLDDIIQSRLKTTCAFETIPMLQDVNASGMKKISYGLWKLKGDVNLLTILNPKNYNKNTKVKELLDHFYSKSTGENVKESELILNFIADEFTKECPNEYDYMISAIFTDMLCANDCFDGILYPSVKLDYKEFNVALKPRVMEKMELLAVEENILNKEQEHADILLYSKGVIHKGKEEIEYNKLLKK